MGAATGGSTIMPIRRGGLKEAEAMLVGFASGSSHDGVILSEKEKEVMRLFELVEEQRLERALLVQDYEQAHGQGDMQGELEEAQKELVEAKATYEVSRRATRMLLMTDPSVRAVHADSISPTEQDILSMVHLNIESSRVSCLKDLGNAEVENMILIEENRELVRSISELVQDNKTWREEFTEPQLRSQLERLEIEQEAARAKCITMKRIVSATIVASGVDWASDEKLTELVIDDESDS
ncbi:hypothetical protein KEM54_006052 [Ascosphaera aggregata]|nr:hypothetical protein KEM54_006052 [Ascosphaera aggregata]